MQEDTVRLLEECDAGISMAISAIDGVLPAVEDNHLRRTLHQSKAAHETLQTQARELLDRHHSPGKAPSAMAKSMNWMKTNTMLTFRPGDASVADLVVTGCGMGVKNLHKYQNRFRAADESSKHVADQLIGLEADLANSLYPYL